MVNKCIGTKELADYLGLRECTVYSWVHTRKIPYYKVGRLIKFRMNEVEEWLENVKVEKAI